jgi:hypothetical protein
VEGRRNERDAKLPEEEFHPRMVPVSLISNVFLGRRRENRREE